MADSSIEQHYRITSNGGTLFIRELPSGQVIGRIPSDRSTHDPLERTAIVTECETLFEGPVVTACDDHGAILVTCSVES